MRLFLPALVLLTLLCSPALADCGDPVALKKTTTENHDAGILVSGDTAILRPFPDKWNALLLRQVVGSEIEVCVTVIARIDEKPLASAGGLQFWRSGQSVEDDFYAIKIDAGGNANISRSEAGQAHDIVKWGRSKLLKKGLNARNVLRLTTSGDSARLYINGKLFKTIERNAGGKIGYGTAVMAEAGKGVAQFDFTDVRSPTQNDTPATPESDAGPASPADGTQKSADATKEVVSPLDAEGKRIYDLLLAVPPSPDDVSYAKTKFVKAIGNPALPESGHGLAEVTYSFEPPPGGTVNRISFFIYPDEAAAAQYMPNPKSPFNMIRDNPEGSFHHATYDATAPFTAPVDFFFGYQTLKRIAWTRWVHQEGRVVMVGFTDETLPPLKEKGVTTDKISDETLDRGLYLVAIAKYQLAAIKDMKISTETAPAAPAPLDVAAKHVFDYLLKTPPDAGSLAALDTALLETTSSLSPKPAHGQAEIVYRLKPPAEGVETSLSYFFYPDEASAARYLDLAAGYDFSVLADLPDGQVGRGTVDPFGPFDQPIPFLDGTVNGEQRGWARLPFQLGRVVIVALVGEKLAGDEAYKASNAALRQGALLLALGRLQLEAAEAAATDPSPAAEASSGAGAGTGTTGQPTGVAPTPKAP